jgi:hypothetical protein
MSHVVKLYVFFDSFYSVFVLLNGHCYILRRTACIVFFLNGLVVYMPQLDMYVFFSVFVLFISFIGGLLSLSSGLLQEFAMARTLDGNGGRLYYYHLCVFNMLSLREESGVVLYYLLCNQALLLSMQHALNIVSGGCVYNITDL